MGLALIGYCIYLIIIWYPEKGYENEFFMIEIFCFEKPYEVYILMAGILLCMLTGVCGVAYGIWCIVMYRVYIKKKGEKGRISSPSLLRKYYTNVGNKST